MPLTITKKPHTLKSTYIADLRNRCELMYYNGETETLHLAFSPEAAKVAKIKKFSYEKFLDKMLEMLGTLPTGYYFADHVTHSGNYLGDNFKEALYQLLERDLVQNIRKSSGLGFAN